ncbi:MAG: hypothetical protein AB1503_02560 [Bacillota bacterium]|nr:hypothetical protein [Bacillota bacterium]
MSRAAENVPGQFVGKVTVEAGGFLPLTPQVLSLLGIKSGDYVYLKAESDRLELRKLRLRANPPGRRLE